MSYLKEEIRYLTDFLSSYRSRIRMLNKCGLFDEAKLFESFAIEVCGLLFTGKKFRNLNETKPNYPFFDLISNDEEIFVQVSTQKDCANKIRDTLDKIEKGDLLTSGKTQTLKFFLMESCDIRVIKSKTIKGIKFAKTKDIVSVDYIITKVSSNPSFCHALYDLISEREKKLGYDSAKLSEAISEAKIILEKRIPDTINGVTHINRDDLIEVINNSKEKCLLIVGDAGSGKSALVKNAIEKEDIILYVRGEELSRGTKYLDIWGFEVEHINKVLNEKRINIFVDSLEYVVGSELNIDVLTRVLSIVNNIDNIKIFLTCRTNDLIALQYCLKSFDIKELRVGKFDDNQIKEILEKYSFLRKLSSGLKQLLYIPFYADFIVSNSGELENVNDENELRKRIFETAISLKNKCKSYGIDYHDVIKVVTSIAEERSKKQVLYVNKIQYNGTIINALLSSNVLIETDKGIRFAFDVFEDTIFEVMLDNSYSEHNGDILSFFSDLDNFGDSCFRRYNIWISNKLKEAKNNSLLLEIINSGVDSKWVEQTKIAIVLSDFSDHFLNHYFKLANEKEVEELIKLINLNAFSIDFDKDVFDISPYLTLIPIGKARLFAINYIFKEYNNQAGKTDKDYIISLLLDGSRFNAIDNETLTKAVNLVEQILEKHLEDDEWCDRDSELLTLLLNNYKLSIAWLKTFIDKINSPSCSSNYFKKEFIDDLLSFNIARLYFKKELNKLMGDFFFDTITNYKPENYSHLRGQKFGLNEIADDVDLTRTKPFNSSCFIQILKGDIINGLKLYIRICNHIVDHLKDSCGTVSFHDIDGQKNYSFIYFDDLYVAGWSDECGLPYLVQDVAYLLIKEFAQLFEQLKKENKDTLIQCAKNIKAAILSSSNNTGPLSLIVLIWYIIFDSYPDYANEFITDYSFVMLDLSRYARTYPNERADYLRKLIAQSVGLPNIDKRYDTKLNLFNMRELFFKSQIITRKTNIVDYCYKKYKKDSKAIALFQSLDIRKAKITKTVNGIIVEGYNKDSEQIKNPIVEANAFITNKLNVINKRMDCIEEAEEICEYISKLDPNIQGVFEKELLLFYVYILSCSNVTNERREEICLLLIEKYETVVSSVQIPSFEHESFLVLFKQIDKLKNEEIIKRIKLLTLAFLQSKVSNNFITNLQNSLGALFETDERYRSCFCNTIIELAKDEKARQKHNLSMAKKIHGNDDLDDTYPISDKYISENGLTLYKSKQNDIIKKYLFQEKPSRFDSDISKYDIHSIIPAIRLFDLDKETFKQLFMNIIHQMLDYLEIDRYPGVISFDESHLCQRKCSNLVLDSRYQEFVIDLLFRYVSSRDDLSESLDWISRVLVSFVPRFFDEKKDRSSYFKYLKKVEERIDSLENESVKNELRIIFTFDHKQSYFGDWSDLNVNYSDFDKTEMIKLFSEYSYLHPDTFFYSIYRLHCDKMQPEIIVSVSDCLNRVSDYKKVLSNQNNNFVIRTIVFVAYVRHLFDIKQSKKLRVAFENVLIKLYENNDAVAMPLLNNLRIS